MDPMVAMVPSTAILPTPLLLERRPSHQFPMQSKLETINRKDPTLPQFKPNAIGHSARGLHRLGQKQHNMDLPAKLVGRTRNQHPDLTIDDVRKCRRCDQDHAKLHASIHRNDPTLPQFRPNAENHFMLCLMCNAYHHESCITPPPGDRMSLNTEINKVIDGLYISKSVYLCPDQFLPLTSCTVSVLLSRLSPVAKALPPSSPMFCPYIVVMGVTFLD